LEIFTLNRNHQNCAEQIVTLNCEIPSNTVYTSYVQPAAHQSKVLCGPV